LIYAWLQLDQFLLSRVYERFFALAAVATFVLSGFFFLVRPADPWRLARHLSLLLALAALVVILVQHVLIHFDLCWKAALIGAVALAAPYLPAAIYRGWAGSHGQPGRGPEAGTSK